MVQGPRQVSPWSDFKLALSVDHGKHYFIVASLSDQVWLYHWTQIKQTILCGKVTAQS